MKQVTVDAAYVADRLAEASGCCLNEKTRVIATPTVGVLIVADSYCDQWGATRSSWEDDSSFAIFLGTDGVLYAFEEWADSTGHGCQCASSLHAFDNVEDALTLGLSPQNRERATTLLRATGRVVMRPPVM